MLTNPVMPEINFKKQWKDPVQFLSRYRPGGGETICPRRWQFDPKIAADLRPSADGPQSAYLWWPAVAKLQAASVPIA